MEKQEILRAWCAERVGCPYVYGGTGHICTPAYRQARMNQYPAYSAKIKANCPRLSGTASACKGCIWADPETGEGRQAFDCAQFSRRAMEAVGIPMPSGANSQWTKTAWTAQGTVDTLPGDQIALLFRLDGDGMGHVGVYQGDGNVIHAKNHAQGVVRERIADTKFTHWGQPEGLADPGEVHPVLRRGDAGDGVALLQRLLSQAGESMTVDGVFGAKTEKAVRQYQRRSGLTADGVAGPKTWTALLMDTGGPEKTDSPEPAETKTPGVSVSAGDWAALKASCAAMTRILQTYEPAEENHVEKNH